MVRSVEKSIGSNETVMFLTVETFGTLCDKTTNVTTRVLPVSCYRHLDVRLNIGFSYLLSSTSTFRSTFRDLYLPFDGLIKTKIRVEGKPPRLGIDNLRDFSDCNTIVLFTVNPEFLTTL